MTKVSAPVNAAILMERRCVRCGLNTHSFRVLLRWQSIRPPCHKQTGQRHAFDLNLSWQCRMIPLP